MADGMDLVTYSTAALKTYEDAQLHGNRFILVVFWSLKHSKDTDCLNINTWK